MKSLILVAVVVIVGGGLWFGFGGPEAPTGKSNNSEASTSTSDNRDRSTVAMGSYTVDIAQSEFRWAGKKPLIEGYVNSGTIDFASGKINVSDTKSDGNFVLDMNNLKVGLTPTKPGKEGALEGHLKGERFFDVAKYPTAEFVITRIASTADSATTFQYQVTGNLTMKGITNEITFPATIYQTGDKLAHAEAQFEIDRTRWGITMGSGNFFTDLGDNLIDDMVALSFTITAKP